MGKLHELLAVEGDLAGQYKKIRQETITTFTKKPDHFLGGFKRLEMFDESKKHEEAAAEQHKHCDTTVGAKLNYTRESAVRYFDALLQKESTNQQAKADLVVDGQTVLEALPATFLLGMETRLKEVREVYEAIPTLAPGIKWEKEETLGDGMWRAAHDEISTKTEKTVKHKVLVQPTDRHPAQVEKWTSDDAVGKFVLTKYSGMLTPAEKSDLLSRIDKLIRACKKARQRANAQEVTPINVAQKMFDYIHAT